MLKTKIINSGKNRIFGKTFQVLLCMLLLAVMAGCGKGEVETAGQKAACTISIKCGTILDDMDNFNPEKKDFVPEDGLILPETEVEIKDGDTVYDILRAACRDNNILMESRNATAGMVYVEGIAQLYEFDGGELSGWMYKVNGVFPEYGSDSVKAQDGDRIEWLYTMNLGTDLGDEHDPES